MSLRNVRLCICGRIFSGYCNYVHSACACVSIRIPRATVQMVPHPFLFISSSLSNDVAGEEG